MSQTFDFYDARANEAAAEAAEATLDNVRDRNLRAEKTWRALADQARKTFDNRVRTETTKAAQRETVRLADLALQAATA